MKMNLPSLLLLLILLSSTIINTNLQAQHVQVNLTIPPPYPIYLENYLNFTNQTIITIQNTSSETRQIKLVASISSDNGISAVVKHTFTPNAPLILNPMETRVLTGGQLKALNNNLKDSDVDVTGTSKSLLMQTATLPEGSYTVCIEPLDYITSQSYASPAGPGCAHVFITQYDPPEIIVPAFEQIVSVTTPQFVNFAWTPAGVASFTRYRFELVDMNFNNLMNINDAFSNPSVQKHYQQNNLLIPNLQYDITKPPLTPGHQYAVRVVAYDPSQKTQFKNNGEGPVSTFFYQAPAIINPNINNPDNPIIIGSNPDPVISQINLNINNFTLPPPPPVDPPQDQGDCIGSCVMQAPAGSPSSIKQGLPVNVGFFKMDITQLNGNSGEGTIFIDFLKTKVKVIFSNLQVNDINTMISGQITAKVDPGSVVSQALANSENSNLEPLYASMSQLLNEVKGNGKKVSMFNANQAAVGLPFSLDNKQFDMVIVGLIFTPTRAFINVVAGLETPQNAVNPYLGVSQNGLGIRPKGFCDDTPLRLSLSQNREIDLVNNGGDDWIKMKYNGAQNGEKTYIKFTCTGAQEMKIDAEMIFGRHYALPVNENAVVQNGNLSVAFVQVLNQNLKDWYIENPQFKPGKYFTLPALQGFRLEAGNMIYDQHSNYTPPGMTFHPNHPGSGGNSKLWKGLFIGDLSIRFPEGFMKDGQPLQVNANNLLMDKTGMWGQVSVNNLIQIQNGDLGGWAFSIDAFNLDIQESTLASGGFSGKIELPISTLGVPYAIQLAGQNGNEYSFGISPGTDIDVHMWIADMTIGQSSSIKIKKSGNSFIPSANLNGSIAISWTKNKIDGMGLQNKPAVGKFSLPTLSVEGMSIITQNGVPKIDKFGLPSLDNLDLPQGEFLAFKINLKKLAIVNNGQGSNGLNMTLELGFDNAGSGGNPLIGGSTTFTLFPKLENKKFKFDKTVLEAVEIEATVGPAELNGGLQLFNSHDVYGEGFRGYINVKMPPLGLEDMSFTLQVGTAPQNYRYWMFDASIKLTTGIACGPGIAIYGFGGGFWYNMTSQGPENKKDAVAVNINDMHNVTKDNIDMSPGATKNGITYTPSQGTKGFRANVILGLIGSSSAFNADVGLAMELGDGFAFNYLEFNGAAFLMQDMTDRGKALVSGSVLIKVESKNYNPNGPILMGEVDVKVNVETLVVDVNASLNLSFMFSPKEWYVNFGSWDTNANPANYDPKTDPFRNRLEIAIPVLKANIQFNCYFMVGTMIPANLPPLPKNVQHFFKGGAGVVNENTKNIASSGLGFAAGAGLHLDVNFKFAIIYVDIQFDMGFDALVQKVKGDCGKVNNPGIGGWYAKGRAYAYCHVEGGLEIDLWFFSGKIPFASFTAGALLQVQGPNPTWVNGRIKFQVSILGGLIKVNTQVVADIGEKCDDGAGSPFDDIPIVSHVDPEDKAVKVDCYTNPQIVFNYPREPFKYEVYDEKKKKNVHKGYSIKLKSHKFSFKEKNTNKTITIDVGTPKYAKDGYSCLLIPTDILPGLSDITYEIVTQGYEHEMDGYLISSKIKTAFPEQIVKGTFRTDSFPDAIRVEDIVYSIPGLGQRYFLKNDYPQGSVQMFQMPCDSLFKKAEASNPDIEYKYKARFTELATNKVTESDCFCNNKLITYSIPPALMHSRIYQLDFIRQSVPKVEKTAEAKSNEKWKKIGDWSENKLLIPNMDIINPDQQKNNLDIQANVNEGPNFPPKNLNIADKPKQKMIAMEVYDREFVESVKTIKIVEKVLFTNYYKNSKYKTKAEKTAQMKEHNQVFSTTYPVVPAHFEGMQGYLNIEDYNIEVPVMLIKTDEGLDQYDVKGFFFSATKPQNLNNMADEEVLYSIHPPVFRLEAGYLPKWLETPYKNDIHSNTSIFQQPDEENFKYKMDIYDPSDQDKKKIEYTYYNKGDLRKYLFWPVYNDWKPFLSTFEEEETEDLIWGQGRFWTGDRFKNVAYFEHLKQVNTNKLESPFMKNDFKYVPKTLPVPQKIGMNGVEQKFIPAAWYRHDVHGPVNFGNMLVYEPEDHLKWADISAEMAKAPQQGNQGNIFNFQVNQNGLNPGVQNGLMNQGINLSADPTKYLAIIDYSEWMAKRDHNRMVNKVLYEFREDVCVGCGTNIASLLDQKDAVKPQFDIPNQEPKDQGFDIDPNEAPPVKWEDYRYTFKYLPMRAWLLHYHRYKARSAGQYSFKLGDKEFNFNVPNYSQNSAWPTDLGIQ